jgi:ABC-type multidrug transport system ATPase subunit
VHTGDEQKHVRQLMKDVGLDNARHKLASDLSGGMKRRLSIAIALVGDSRIVFMDEPTTGMSVL